MTSTPQFDASISRAPPWWAFGGGSLFSALLAMLIWQQATGRRRAETLAHSMTTDLDRLAQVAKHTSNSVSIVGSRSAHHLDQRRVYPFDRIHVSMKRWAKTRATCCTATTPSRRHAGHTPTQSPPVSGWRMEILVRAKDGLEYWLDTEIQPLLDARGKPVGFMEIGNDVTARKIAGRELARERNRLDNIIEGTNAGTWEWDLATGETVLNERWAQIVGHTLAELGDATIETWIGRTHPDDIDPTRAKLRTPSASRNPGIRL